MNRRFDTILRGYMWVLMSGLLLQGLGSLAFRLQPALPAAAPYVVRGLFGIDTWHAWIHIGWGMAGDVLLVRWYTPRTASKLALVFGIFYSALAVLGVIIHHPFGLELDALENGFHLIAGPLTLLLGWLSWRAMPPPQVTADSAPV